MTTPNPVIKLFIVLAVYLLPCVAFSQTVQHFRYKADVGKVDSTGVYKIALKPGLVAKSVNSSLYDIRLVDDKGRFVAYVIITNPKDKLKPFFYTFPEVKQVAGSDTVTTYIAENIDKINPGDSNHRFKISQLWLKIRNTTVTRSVNLSGSDDLEHWFAIKEGIRLQEAGDSNETEYEQMLDFPESNYRYFRIQISNSNKDLIPITRAGIYLPDAKGDKEPGRLTQLPQARIITKNGDKQTSYYVGLDDMYVVDGLLLDIPSPRYYNRHISIYDAGDRNTAKLYDDSITSTRRSVLAISAKTNKLRIDITNGDDNPLVVKNITAMVLPQFAVAYLEKGRQYYLLDGDSTANEVSYDLTFLHSKPMSEFPVIEHSAVYKNPVFASVTLSVKHDYTLLIWVSIAVVLLILGLLTWRMVKELNTKPRE